MPRQSQEVGLPWSLGIFEARSILLVYKIVIIIITALGEQNHSTLPSTKSISLHSKAQDSPLNQQNMRL
jgi:hypothetical protein